MRSTFIDADVIKSRFERLKEVLDRSALRQAPSARRAARGGARRGTVAPQRSDALGPHAPGQAHPLRLGRRVAARGLLVMVDVTYGAPVSPAGRVRLDGARASTQGSHSPPALVSTEHVAVALVGPTASGKSALAHAAGLRPPRQRRDPERRRDDASIAAWTSAPRNRRASSAAKSATTSSTSSTPSEEFTVAQYQRAARVAAADVWRAGHKVALRGRHRTLRTSDPRRPRDTRPVPARARAAGRTRARRAARALRRTRGPRPRGGQSDGADQRPSDRARARGHPGRRTTVLLLRRGPRHLRTGARRPDRPAESTSSSWTRASRAGSARGWTRACSRR